jgi:hypothetical protein
MPIHFDGALPLGALVGTGFSQPTAPRPVAAKVNLGPPAPIWFSTAQSERLGFNRDQRVTAWQAMPPATVHARPVHFNAEGTGWDSAARALDFVEKTHGGLCIEAALPQAQRFSVGLIYTPPVKRDAQTLLSLQAKGAENYLFLSAENDFVRFGMKGGDANLSAPDPQKLTLLVLSSDGAKVRMALNRDLAISVDCKLDPAALDIFIGCRGETRSLLNKLGSFKLTDVLIWPDQDVLAGEVVRAPDAALALWQERLRHAQQG